jgi:hypothetical protein
MYKRALILLLLALASLPPRPAPAEEDARFGRLFMEPNTRRQLDESRKQNSSAQPLPAESEIEEDAPLTALKVDGVLMRGDGSTEVWVNGVRGDSRLTVRRAGGNRFRVSVPGAGEVTMKPGQVYSFESRRVLEGYEAAREAAAAEPDHQTATPQKPAQAPLVVKSEPATAPEIKTPNTETDRAAEFDEAELAGQDFRIRLQEERMEKPGQEKSAP